MIRTFPPATPKGPLPILVRNVVPDRDMENGLRLRVTVHLLDGVALIRFRKMADVSGVQKEFRSNH